MAIRSPSNDDDRPGSAHGAGGESSLPGFAAEPRIGRRYVVLNLLGAGGMGNVYRARDEELGEIVALKMIRPDLLGVPDALERFRREVRLARRVTHRNIARMFDIGEHGDQRFLTMELVEGRSLESLLSEVGRLRLDRAADLAVELCAGLAAAHRAGVVHRDLKPANVLLAADGHPVITDFGIARAEVDARAGMTAGITIGTPDYMAPEQVNALPDIDGRADLYSLGVMLYEMVVGERPWQGPSDIAIVAARLIHPPPDPRLRRPDLPAPWAALILRLMATAREDRPPTADEVADALAALPSVEAPAAAPSLPTAALAPAEVAAATILAPAPAFAPPETTAGTKSVAVLPFRNAGPPEDDYLAEGITEELIDTLSMVRGLRVRSRGVVVSYRNSQLDPRQIGAELRVHTIVEGTLRRLGERVRLSVRIVSVADGFQLWAQRQDHAIGDLFEVGDALARTVAAALTVDVAAAAHAPLRSPAAVDLYLRARHAYHHISAGDVDVAVNLFREALAHAPGDAMILAGYAMACARRAFFRDDQTDLAVAADIAERAIAAAPQLGEVYCARANVHAQRLQMVDAVNDLRRALRHSPQLAEAHFLLGRLLAEAADVAPAMRHLSQAIALDPAMELAYQDLARLHALLERPDEVERLAHSDPTASTWFVAARDTFWRGDRERAVRVRALLPEHMSMRIPAELLLDAVRDGTPLLDSPLTRQLMPPVGEHTAPRRRAFRAQLETEAHSSARRVEEALASLRRSVDAGLIDLLWLNRCPLLVSLRGDLRFVVLRDEVARRAAAISAAYEAPATV